MHAPSQIRSLLRSGDRRTVGKVPAVVKMVSQHLELLPDLVECLFDADTAVRMRAADALEKISRVRCGELDRYASVLLDLFAGTEQQELRWHLAVVLPRLHLSRSQRLRTADVLQACLEARSSIVRTSALQGMADLTVHEPSLRPLAIDHLRSAERSGTPAMKARSRKLLAKLEKDAHG